MDQGHLRPAVDRPAKISGVAAKVCLAASAMFRSVGRRSASRGQVGAFYVEHHSRKQPRSQTGQFAAADSFDGKLAAFQKVLVDLDGDGKPDAVMPAPEQPKNAMLQMAKLTDRPPTSDAHNVPRNPAAPNQRPQEPGWPQGPGWELIPPPEVPDEPPPGHMFGGNAMRRFAGR